MKELFEFDKSLKTVIGTDEAGRGPAAGGVFAACVHFPEVTNNLIKDLEKLNDSKKLSKKAREKLFDIIINNSINSIICVEVEEIEKINILNSSLKAMKLACENVIKEAKLTDFITLVDGNKPIKNYIQLKYNKTMEMPDYDSPDAYKKKYLEGAIKDPEVELLIIPTIEDVKFDGNFDYAVMAQSPNYTPASADFILDIFREYIEEI